MSQKFINSPESVNGCGGDDDDDDGGGGGGDDDVMI